ncbi:MAG: TolC family protein [Desulfotomaculum sp.]|nr:TolC family protein [Desulfotomaculum sp.]
MSKRLILILAMLFVLGSSVTSYAAEEAVADANVITLEQAKSLVKENSRNLRKYEINVDKAKYKQRQIEDQYNDMIDMYNSLSAALSAELEKPDSEKDQAKIQQLESQMEAQYDKIKSSSDSSEDAENSYDDAVKEEENYRKQIDYIVEELYTTILKQEDTLFILNKELELKQHLLNVERKKLGLGSSSQSKVDELVANVTELNKKIIAQTNEIKTNKGQLNDMMGRDYNDELNLAPFEVSTSIEIPEFEQLLSSASTSYDRLYQLKRDINKLDDDLDKNNDYYEYLLLRLEIKEKELELADEQSKLNETINRLLTDAKSKQEDYQLALINYRNAQRSYQWDKKRYELGQISKLALMESELNYLNMKSAKDSAGYALFLTKRSIELAEIGII